MTTVWHWGLAGVLVGAAFTAVTYHYAWRAGWWEPISARSSHARPTVTGGGIALVVGWLGLSVTLSWFLPHPYAGLSAESLALLAFGTLLIAGVGLWDDLTPLPILPRLGAQSLAVFAVLIAIGLPEPLRFGDFWFGELMGYLLTALAGVWFVNLFNFMDGIDGIAASEAIFVAAMAAWLLSLAGYADLASGWAILVGLGLAFLFWNWAPARLFMGDVGSGFLGFIVMAGLFLAVEQGGLKLVTALILPAAFVCDTTFTLLRRIMRGDAWYQSHRMHAYQRLAKRWGSHGWVTFALMSVNILLIGPLAWWVERYLEGALAWVVLVATYAVLLVLVARLGAGRLEDLPVSLSSAHDSLDDQSRA